jgi:hypothetical protein
MQQLTGLKPTRAPEDNPPPTSSTEKFFFKWYSNRASGPKRVTLFWGRRKNSPRSLRRARDHPTQLRNRDATSKPAFCRAIHGATPQGLLTTTPHVEAKFQVTFRTISCAAYVEVTYLSFANSHRESFPLGLLWCCGMHSCAKEVADIS